MFCSPEKRYSHRARHKEINNFNEGVIRRTTDNFYCVKKEAPTLSLLLTTLSESIEFQSSKTKLREILKRMGHRWQKTKTNQKFLMERWDAVAKRMTYLLNMKRFREEGRNIVFIDETFLHANHVKGKCWQNDQDDSHSLAPPSGPGQRLIIVHAGSKDGFVLNALLIFKSKQKSGDYHDEMNFENFSKWLREMLISNLAPRFVVMMDNAPYHSKIMDKRPTAANRKAEIQFHQDWLQRRNIPFASTMLRAELLALSKSSHSEQIYNVDHVLMEHGHTGITLPPYQYYHADLNPIELIGANVENFVVSKNVKCTISDAKKLAEERFCAIGMKEWADCCAHVEEFERDYWERNIAVENEIERVIVELGADSEGESESESDSEDD